MSKKWGSTHSIRPIPTYQQIRAQSIVCSRRNCFFCVGNMITRGALRLDSLCRPTSCLVSSKRTSITDRSIRNIKTTEADDPEFFEKSRSNPLADIEERVEESKRRLKWRQPIIQQGRMAEAVSFLAPTRFRAVLENFHRAVNEGSFLKVLESLVQQQKCLDQRFIADRHRILGNDLAAAHFIVARGGQVKYVAHFYVTFCIVAAATSPTRPPCWLCVRMRVIDHCFRAHFADLPRHRRG